jgi:hypothetical protein
MPKGTYLTAGALRTALEHRLSQRARELGTVVQRMRYLVTFDRFLARLVTIDKNDWTLKGGYAMELRIDQARTTKDVDLSIRMFGHEPSANELSLVLLERLREVAAIDLGDFFEFTVGAAESDVKDARYGGVRFPVVASLDGRVFQEFRVDVVVGDPPAGQGEELVGEDWLGFAGIEPARVFAIRTEQQFAEKLHAYTFPRSGTPNSRVKDLVDMLLLIKRTSLSEPKLSEAIRATFTRRGTHAIPVELSHPPADWSSPFSRLAKECGLEEGVEEAHAAVRAFLAPILAKTG